MEAAKKPTPIAISTTSSMAITHEFLLSQACPMAPNPSQDELAASNARSCVKIRGASVVVDINES
jgi:hypothetical protein